MNYRLTISEAAEDDILQAFLWYEQQLPNLGDRFEKHISSATLTILENPLKFEIRYGRTRICFLKKFPYGIHFVLNEYEILIVAVFHTSRNPKRWEKRTW